ncbi:restriction endonuclease [Pseudomonas fluorescens]|uniref:restriction endonuclease n=1 Tax=Pseudomonas fluorescens TaxID=294 RepID=UPI003F9AFC8C
MKALLNWALKNAWNLFGAIGVAGTFYFSLLYVPDYVNEITTGKINVIHESLMDDIQEVVFYEKSFSIRYIETLVHGKEMSQGVSYPYTADELLIQVQERFMGNKFITLEKREKMFNAIDLVRSGYKPINDGRNTGYDWPKIISWLLSGLGALMASVGAVSLARKQKIDQETEADIISGEIVVTESGGSMTLAAFEFERMVGDILSEIGVLKADSNNGFDTGYDFLVESKNKEFIVEVKKYRRMLGLSTARDFLGKVALTGKGGVLIVSSGVTQRAQELFFEHNKLTDNQKVFLIVGDSKELIRSKLVSLFESVNL